VRHCEEAEPTKQSTAWALDRHVALPLASATDLYPVIAALVAAIHVPSWTRGTRPRVTSYQLQPPRVVIPEEAKPTKQSTAWAVDRYAALPLAPATDLYPVIAALVAAIHWTRGTRPRVTT
jgi:hypothetical protein